jgi:hypothetical protein
VLWFEMRCLQNASQYGKRTPTAGGAAARLAVGSFAFLLGGYDAIGSRDPLPVRLIASFFFAIGADRFRMRRLLHVGDELRVIRLAC